MFTMSNEGYVSTEGNSLFESAEFLVAQGKIIECCDKILGLQFSLTEADDADAEKISKVKELIEKIKKALIKPNMKQVMAIGIAVKAAVSLLVSIGAYALTYFVPLAGLILAIMAFVHINLWANYAENHPEEMLADIKTNISHIKSLYDAAPADSKEKKKLKKKLDNAADYLVNWQEFVDKKKERKQKKENAVNKISMSEAVINYDFSDLTQIIKESDESIDTTVNAYQVLLKKSLTESAGVKGDEVYTILESANNKVGKMILDAIARIREFVQKRWDQISAALSNFYNNNMDVIAKVAKKIEEKHAAGVYKNGPKTKLYFYSFNALTFGSADNIMKNTLRGYSYDMYSSYKKKNAEGAETIKDDEAKLKIIKDIYRGPDKSDITLANYKEVIHKGIRGDGNRKEVSFDMKYLEIIKSQDTKKGIDSLYKDIIAGLNTVEAEAKSRVASLESGEASEEASKEIGFFKNKIRVMNVIIETVINLNAIKMQAATEQISEARKFCLKAFVYGGKDSEGKDKKDDGVQLNGAIDDTPYCFSLIETSIYEEGELEDSLTESTQEIW